MTLIPPHSRLIWCPWVGALCPSPRSVCPGVSKVAPPLPTRESGPCLAGGLGGGTEQSPLWSALLPRHHICHLSPLSGVPWASISAEGLLNARGTCLSGSPVWRLVHLPTAVYPTTQHLDGNVSWRSLTVWGSPGLRWGILACSSSWGQVGADERPEGARVRSPRRPCHHTATPLATVSGTRTVWDVSLMHLKITWRGRLHMGVTGCPRCPGSKYQCGSQILTYSRMTWSDPCPEILIRRWRVGPGNLYF